MKIRERMAICGAELPDSLEDLLNEGEVEEGLKESKERKKKAKKRDVLNKKKTMKKMFEDGGPRKRAPGRLTPNGESS